MTDVRHTICNRDCPDACGILAAVEGGRVVALKGDPAHPVTRGFLCYRTGHLLDSPYHRERLLAPLYRERIGDPFRELSWEQAFDLAAARLTKIREESGPAAIFHYRSGGSLGLLKALTDHFFELFGPVTTKRGDICSGAGDAAQERDFGLSDSNDLDDLVNAKNILLWGKNVFVSSPHTIPVLLAAKKRGARLVLIDPVHHKTSSLCERFVQVRPGGDFTLAMAVGRILFEEGWTDPHAGAYCDHLDGFRALCERRRTEEWCALADVSVDEARDLAERLGRGGPTTILVGWGMGRRCNGSAIVRALDALGAITGNLGIPGGGVSFYFRRRQAFDLSFVHAAAVAPRTICEPLFGPEVLAARDPEIRAVWVTAGNPVAMLPESETTRRALETREFVVVVDSSLTDTARAAHLVLPTTTLLEADDLVGAYGHHYLGAATPVVPRPPSVRSDLEIMQALAERTGLGRHLRGTAHEWKERIIARTLRPRGIDVATLEAGVVRNPMADEVLFADRRFATESRRVNLLRQLPDTIVSEPDPEYPLTLMAISTDEAQSSQWALEHEGPAVATLHPDAAPGFDDGSVCRLVSRLGAMTVRVHHDPRQRRDLVLLPKGGHLHRGHCANALVHARLTDDGEGGALYDEGVRLERG